MSKINTTEAIKKVMKQIPNMHSKLLMKISLYYLALLIKHEQEEREAQRGLANNKGKGWL